MLPHQIEDGYGVGNSTKKGELFRSFYSPKRMERIFIMI
jgi:hypothetical protein